MAAASTTPLAERLRVWFERERRPLPWRAPLPAGPVADALARDRGYTFLLIETMAQQTRIETVLLRLPEFLGRFPDVAALGSAPLSEVLASWAGLGYYRRARNLHAAARRVVANGGLWPRGEAGWRELPGVGAYTAAALALQVEGVALPAVDGNVRRVGARLLGEPNPRPARLRDELVNRFGLHGQVDPSGATVGEGLIELGALVCTPRRPRCPDCPLRVACAAHRAGASEQIPAAKVRPGPMAVELHAHLVLDGDGRCALEQRPASGWWPGTWGLPWRPDPPAATDGATLLGRFEHRLTHRRITAHVWLNARIALGEAVAWRSPQAARELPTIDRRALALAAHAAGSVTAVG
jgi:A/G-specific adenine glycosylase